MVTGPGRLFVDGSSEQANCVSRRDAGAGCLQYGGEECTILLLDNTADLCNVWHKELRYIRRIAIKTKDVQTSFLFIYCITSLVLD